MKVGMNGWSLPPQVTGGLDIHIWELARALAKKDVDVQLFLPRANCNTDCQRPEIIPISYSGDLSYEGATRLNSKIFNQLRKDEIDLFHSQDWFGVEAGYRVKKHLNGGWVFSCHSLERMRAGEGNENSHIQRREKLGIEKSDKVITVSRWMKREIVDRFNVEEDKVVVIGNGRRNLETSNFSPRQEHDIGDDFFVLYLGRLAEQKGVRYLIYAAKKILEEFDGVKFIIGGRGPLSKPLQKFADLLGVEEDVIFTGFIPENKLSSYYSEADVFVSPSLHEPFGMTLLEARQQGTTLITTPAGALETMESDSGVISIRKRNSGSIARAIKDVMQQTKRQQPASSEVYSWTETASATREIYRQVLG